jgi:DNA-binding GntR family transcriptional regulator
MSNSTADEGRSRTQTPGSEGTAAVARLSNMALRDRAYMEIAMALRSGRLTPASTVTIRSLAAMLGTSTMPVREAVSRLMSERALEILPNRTLRVPKISATMLDELTEARLAVEGRAAALAAQRMTHADFSLIKAANERYDHALEAGNPIDASIENERLHFAIYRAARSDVLLSIINTLWLQSGPYVASVVKSLPSGTNPHQQRGLTHHFDILAALARRDPAAALAAVQADIADAAQWYKQQTFATMEAD